MLAVIQHLYLGRRPSQAEMAMNGSILNRLHTARHYSWEELRKVVEGLGLLKQRGKLLPTVSPVDTVSLRWVYDSGQMLNQVQVCLDAYYAAPAKPVAKRGGEMSGIGDVLSNLTTRIG